MPGPSERSGTIKSGDATLFFRLFGEEHANATPLIILHGSNYFDSYDWIGVASALADERPVVTFDHRGFGQSGWSENKDYSLDAILGDVRNIAAHFGWKRPVIMGHSMSGRLGIFFAANFPDDLSRLIVLDSALGKGAPGEYVNSVGKPPQVFASVEAAMAHLATKENPPRFAVDRARAELGLMQVEGGYVLRRDPDYRNTQSQAPGAAMPKLRDLDAWQALSAITCPVAFIRGGRSDRNKPEYYDRIARDFPQFRVETVDSRHDLAYEAPDELVATVKRVLA